MTWEGEANVAGDRTWRVDRGRLTLALAVVGGSALALGAVASLLSPPGLARLYHAYLANAAFAISLALGALFFVIAHHLTRAAWSVVVRRLAELLAAALPWLALLFVPIVLLALFGDGRLYAWSDPAARRADALLDRKGTYLNGPFFGARTVVYFALWALTAGFYLRQSVRQDEARDARITLRMRWWSPLAMIGFALTVCLAAFDWLMTLEPRWYSTIFGVYYFSGAVSGFFALLILLCLAYERRGPLAQAITEEHYHDLGKLLFGFVFFWGYIAFSQYLLIWYANIPEETVWYRVRQTNGWAWLSLGLLFGHFLIPFVGLLGRWAKRRRAVLGFWAALLLAMHWLDVCWLALPAASPDRLTLGLVELCCLVAVGCWSAIGWLRVTDGRPLIPVGDPQLPESLAFENV